MANILTSSSSHTVVAQGNCTNIPLASGKAQEDESILPVGFLSHGVGGSSTWIRRDRSIPVDCAKSLRGRHAGFMIAPSIAMPERTNFQSAIRSLRASAMIAAFLRRPSVCFTRSWNHRVSADLG